MSSATPVVALTHDSRISTDTDVPEGARLAPVDDRLQLITVLHAAPVAIYHADRTGRVTYGNRHYREMFELADGDSYETWAHVIHPDDRARVLEHWADVVRQPRTVQFEYRTLSSEGVSRWRLERVVTLPGARDGGLLGTITDVTELRDAQGAVAKMASYYQTTFDHLPVGLVHVDAAGRILRVNAATSALLGYGPDELRTRALTDIVHPADAGATLERLTRMSNGERGPGAAEMRCVRKDGVPVCVRLTSTPICNPDGTFAYCVGTIEDLTSRNELARAAQRDRDFTAAVVDNVPVALFACDVEQNVRIFNQASIDIFDTGGASPVGSALPQLTALAGDLYFADGTTPVALEKRPLRQALRGETVWHSELVSGAPGTVRRNLLGGSAPLLDASGAVIGAVGVFQDITERKALDELTRALSSELTAADPQRLLEQAVTHLSRLLGTEIAFVGRVSRSNPCKITTLARWEDGQLRAAIKYDLNNATWNDADPTTDVIVVPAAADEGYPDLLPSVPGEIRGLALARLRGPGGRVSGVVGLMSRRPLATPALIKAVMEAITLRLGPELERHRADERLADLFELAPDPMVTTDACGVITAANRRAEIVFGWPRGELAGRPISTLVPDLFIAHFARDPGETAAGPLSARNAGQRLDLPARHRDGTEFPAGVTLSSLDYDDGITVVVSMRNISERINAERAARQAHVLLDAIEDAAYVWDPDSLRVTYANEGASNALGYTRAELLQMEVSDVLAESSVAGLRAAIAPILRREISTVRVTAAHRRKNGETFPVELSVQLASRRGEAPQLVAIARDISDRVRQMEQLQSEVDRRLAIEADLRLAQKLEAVGRLASGVAHELNTPIQYIGDSVHFLRSAFDDISRLLALHATALERLPPAEPLRVDIEAAARAIDLPFVLKEVPRAFERTIEGTERVGTIVRAMKEFAHESSGEQSPGDLNRALQTTLVIACNEYKYAATAETRFGAIPEVTCNLGELNQVFLNLLVNAAHAIADAGKDVSDGRIVIGTHQDGDHVEVYVEDNGCGIPTDIAHRIYDPFFTTKEVGRGSGQGLAICRSIVVERHGGQINVTSTAGTGSRFTVRLPIAGFRPDNS